MVLGIFGDSFGSWLPGGDDSSGIPLDFSWPSLLSKKLKAACLNYAQGGSSLFYSYNMFLEHADRCDVIIFLCTNPGRYTKPMLFEKALPSRIHPNGLLTVEHFLKRKEITDQERIRLEWLKGFYLMQDFDWENTACNLLVDHLLAKHPNVIYVPCFNFYKDKLSSNISMQDIMDYQLDKLNAPIKMPDFTQKYAETNNISCHFTPEANQFVADCMFKSIENGKWTIEDNYNIDFEHDLSYYYKKI